MLTAEQFEQEIFEKTGKKIGDYGFIAGTKYPIGELKGMQSASLVSGFIVWKKTNEGSEQVELNPKTQEESLEQIIEFLNAPVV